MNLTDRLVNAYRQGTKYRWVACIAARRVVGSYKDGETREIARQLSISVSQVENLARAGQTRYELRRHGLESSTVEALTPSHFAEMGKLLRRYEFSPYEAIEDLRTAAEEGVSVAAMSSTIRNMYGDGKSWQEQWALMLRCAANLEVDSDAPPWMRAAAANVLALEKVHENETRIHSS